MVRTILLALGLTLFASCANAQQSSNGRFYPQPVLQTIPIYGAVGATGSGTSSPQTISLGTLPVGTTVAGILSFDGTAASGVTIGDGTGSCGLTGTDSVTIESAYANGTTYTDYAFYLTNTQTSQTNLVICWTGTVGYFYYGGVELFGTVSLDTNSTSGGYVHAQGTSGTAYQSPTITTTGGNDIMVGIQSNNSGGTITAGGDGQGHTYTIQQNSAGVITLLTLQETSNNSYYAAVTGPNIRWNMHLFAFQPTMTTGEAVNYQSNGKNYVQAQGGNGKFYGGAQAQTCLEDFHAGTNGSAPTAANLFSGVQQSGTACIANSSKISLSATGANYQYVNALQPVTLTTPAIIGGAGYAGNGGLEVGGVTSGSGTSLGQALFESSASGSSTSFGYSVYTDCPGTIGLDCGAVGGSVGGSDYVYPHFRQFGSSPSMDIAMENQTGAGATYYPLPGATRYRINIQQNSSGTNYMVVCDAGNRMIYSIARSADVSAGSTLSIGISGEEPSVSGYHYYWFNPVINFNGTINLNGPCF